MRKTIPFIVTAITFMLFACNNRKSPNVVDSIKIDTVQKISMKTAEQSNTILNSQPDYNLDTITFKYFENLVIKEQNIPSYIINKYVKESILFNNDDDNTFIGKGVFYNKNYKLFYLKYGNDKKGFELFITFNYHNIIIDTKSFKYYCSNCNDNELIAYVYFENNKNNAIVAEYYHPQETNAMPNSDELEIINKEIWDINKLGHFELRD